MACNLNKSIAFDCSNLPQGGIEPRVIFIDFDKYRDASLNGGVTIDVGSGEVTGITLQQTGDQGYDYQVAKGSNIIATSPLRQVDGIDGYDHTVQTRVTTIDALDRAEISKMRFNKVVAIVELSEGRSRLYGAGVGLRLSEFDANEGDAGTAGTINFTAVTDSREAPESQEPLTIAAAFDIDTLLTPIP